MRDGGHRSGGDLGETPSRTADEPERNPEEQEMRVAWFGRRDFESMVRDGRIVDVPSLAAYALLGLR